MSEDARFPITLWPGVPVPVPPVRRRAVETVGNGWLVYVPPTEELPLEDELILRGLFTVDLDQPDAAVAFLGEHGMIDRRFDLPDLRAEIRRPKMVRRRNGQPVSTVHTVDAVLYLKVARLLARHWELAELDGDVLDAWREARFDDVLAASPNNPDLAWQFFTLLLNEGLREFAVRAEKPSRSLDVVLGVPRPDLFGALCLQLANLIAEGLPPQHCANETCGLLFVRQLGGAEHGQYRTRGVLYCSPGCAKAQAMRELRRRQRKEQR